MIKFTGNLPTYNIGIIQRKGCSIMRIPEHLYVIRASETPRDELSAAIILEGVLARKEPRMVIDADVYLSYIDREKCTLTESDFWSLFVLYRDEYSSGFITYSLSKDDPSLNMASVIAASRGIPALPDTMREKALSLGFKELYDLSLVKGDYIDRQRVVFLSEKDRLSKKELVHMVTKGDDYPIQMRDYSIARGYFSFYTGEKKKDKEFRREVLEWADRNIPIYGWTTDEIDFVNDISQYGDYVIPSDWSVNHSLFASDAPIKIKQKKPRSDTSDGKHYICLQVSDGDNAQWLERNFATSSTFGERLESIREGKGKYIVNWTFQPSLCVYNPYAVEKIYSLAERDLFVCGVSGAGYMNCTRFPNEYLKGFVDKTAEYMKYTDMNIVTLLDNKLRFDSENEEFIREKLDFYAEREEIIGGLWEMDPDRYEDGHGKIYFSSNGKPFVSVRFSLWHPSCKPGRITKSWLKGYADRVNSMPCDKSSPEGYSLINVHPWTMTVSDLDTFVSMLGENVEILDAEAFIKMIKENVRQ